MKIFTSGKAIFCALSLCALFGATAAQAQNYSIRVDVPFQFMAGEKMYPAGDYRLTVDGAVHTLTIRPKANTSINMVPLTPGFQRRTGGDLEKGMVRFTKAGDLHVLNGVWRGGAADGNVTYMSRKAKEAVKNAKTGSQSAEIPAGNGADLQ
jgi:hypothetical protein